LVLPVDIFLGYGWVVAQILTLAGLATLVIGIARWFKKREVSHDWYFLILTIFVIVVTQVVAILLANQQSQKLLAIEHLNKELNTAQLKAQNLTLQNQELLKENNALELAIAHKLNVNSSK
jgi:hypothetical protein